jgi:hypothetical protein
MKRDDGEAATGLEQTRRIVEQSIELFELGVDVDADRLERAGRRMQPRAQLASLTMAHRIRDNVGQRVRRARACVDDRGRDASRVRLLAEVAEDPAEAVGVDAREEVRGGLTRVGVHPHIEGGRAAEREAALGRIELQRRHAEVGDDRRHARHAEVGQRRGERGEAAVHEVNGRNNVYEAHAGFCEGLGVAVDRDRGRRSKAFEHRERVATEAAGRIDEDPSGRGVAARDHALEGVANLTHEHGRVSARAAHGPPLPAQSPQVKEPAVLGGSRRQKRAPETAAEFSRETADLDHSWLTPIAVVE